MNAMQHYREAEQALRHAWSGESSDPELTIATAQVHATLALAAVQAMTGPWRDDTTRPWQDTFNAPGSA